MTFALPRGKKIEFVTILLFLFLLLAFLAILYVDKSESHIYSSGFFNILTSIVFFYVDKKFILPTKIVETPLDGQTAVMSKIQQLSSTKNAIPPYVKFIGLLLLILTLNNIFFSAFQYSLESLNLPDETTLTFLLTFGGYLFFISILPLSALGAMLIGSSKQRIRLLHAVIASFFTFGFFFLLSAMQWTNLHTFPIAIILSALFHGNIDRLLPTGGTAFLYVLSFATDSILVLLVSSWLYLWGKIGNWRFQKSIG